MAKTGKKLKKRTFRHSVLLNITMFFSVFAILTAVYILIAGGVERRKQARNTAEQKIVRLASQIDTVLGNIENFYTVALESADIAAALKNPDYYRNSETVREFQNILGGAGIYDNIIFEYYLADIKAGIVVSDEGMFPKNEFPMFSTAGEILSRSGKSRYWSYAGNGVAEYIRKLPLGSTVPTAVFVANINTNTIKNAVPDVFSGPEIAIILDENGRIVTSSLQASENERLEKIVSTDRNKNIIKIKGLGKYIARFEKSKNTDLEYIILSPQNRLPGFADSASFIGAIVLVLVASMLFFLTFYAVFRPVSELFKKVGAASSDMEGQNELEYIEKHFHNLSADKDALKETVGRQQDSIQQMFELHLLNDGIRSNDEWDDYFEALNLPKYECFATTVAVLDVRYDSHIQTSLDEDALCLQLIEDMPEDIRKYLWMPPVYNSCTIFSLIGSDDEDDLLKKVGEYYEKMQKYCKDTIGLYILMGVSGTHKNHKSIRLAYRESAMALMYNEDATEDYQEKERIVVENGVDTSRSLRFYVDKMFGRDDRPTESYNTKYENDVYLAMKEGDTQRAYKCTDRFAEFLLVVKTTDDALHYILRYADQIVMTALESNIALNEIFPSGMRFTYRELISELEPRRIRVYLKQYFIDPVIRCMNEHMQDRSNQVMKMIDDLLDETHGNILLSECADRLGLNQNYIWKVLKKERGKGFTEYAEKRKTDEAKKLLLEKDLSVQEIAVTLGYANAQNFIRFFSKATGITPGKYRKMY